MVDHGSHDNTSPDAAFSPEPFPGQVLTAVCLTAVVDSVSPMATNTWSVRLRCPELARQILPGQFFMIRPADGSDPLLGRPFALYDTYAEEDGGVPVGVEFGYVVVGKLTGLMASWTEGTEVEIWGPLGNGFPCSQAKQLICVAGGIGQTPMLGVIREALKQKVYGSPTRSAPAYPCDISLCYGVRSAEYLAGVEEFRGTGVTVDLATDDGTAGHHGYVTDLLRKRLESCAADETDVYCCGPEPMMKAVAELCAEFQVRCLLSLETPMACGFGACFSCVAEVCDTDGNTDYVRTCVEGPVFDATRLVLR